MGKDKEPDLLMSALIFGGSIAVGLGAGYVLRPFIEDLLKPKVIQSNPNPEPHVENQGEKTVAYVESVKAGQNPYTNTVTNLRAKFTYDKFKENGKPIIGTPIDKKLNARYSGS